MDGIMEIIAVILGEIIEAEMGGPTFLYLGPSDAGMYSDTVPVAVFNDLAVQVRVRRSPVQPPDQFVLQMRISVDEETVRRGEIVFANRVEADPNFPNRLITEHVNISLQDLVFPRFGLYQLNFAVDGGPEHWVDYAVAFDEDDG